MVFNKGSLYLSVAGTLHAGNTGNRYSVAIPLFVTVRKELTQGNPGNFRYKFLNSRTVVPAHANLLDRLRPVKSKFLSYAGY